MTTHPREDLYLTATEIAALRALTDDLVAATDNHTHWLGRVRETSLEIQRTIDRWLAEPPNYS